ncbi:MAG: carbohydrate kinase family protein [Akkermansiaceae bacterium]|nr:carbohydrate kinase family protein [Akkermansiaceae bacterium]
MDIICDPVESRASTGDDYSAFPTMRDFGQRIVDADGKSAMIEIVRTQEKIGGNGPIMANALASSIANVHYIGTLGNPDIHPAYSRFSKQIRCHSIAPPAVTHALEFNNGKVMLVAMSDYKTVTAESLAKSVGRDNMERLISESNLVGLLNWTCLPGLNGIMDWLLQDILPETPPRLDTGSDRLFFFDLADPSMHDDNKISTALERIRRFSRHGNVVLGMNLNETQQICRVLSLPVPESTPTSLCRSIGAIREQLSIHMVMSHPTDFAACATSEGSWSVQGPHTKTPKITTGAGDHLNAGFCLALMLGLHPEDALKLGVLYSGYYVRMAEPPKLIQIPKFIQSLSA